MNGHRKAQKRRSVGLALVTILLAFSTFGALWAINTASNNQTADRIPAEYEERNALLSGSPAPPFGVGHGESGSNELLSGPLGVTPTPQGQFAVDIYKAMSRVVSLVKSIGGTRVCSVIVENTTSDEWQRTHASKKSQDSWRQSAPGVVRSWPQTIAADAPFPYNDRLGYWTTSGGFMRGCWNQVIYTGDNGTVKIQVDDPWSGKNSFRCDTTGDYGCIEQYIPNATSWGGNHLIATYCVYDDVVGWNWCRDA